MCHYVHGPIAAITTTRWWITVTNG